MPASFELAPSSQLIFQESSDKLFAQNFRITNPSNEAIIFKIKTTSPKHYVVRPNVGQIPPGKSVDIEVLLQPRKDKFLIIGAPAGNRASEDIANPEFWADLEMNHKDFLTEKRLKCVFTVETSSPATSGVNTNSATSESSSSEEITKANERIKKLEYLLAESRRSTKASTSTTSGIIPSNLASSLFMSSPSSMFPPLLVVILMALAFLLGKII